MEIAFKEYGCLYKKDRMMGVERFPASDVVADNFLFLVIDKVTK